MLVISSKEFIDNPIPYLNRIDRGEQLILQRGKSKAYSIRSASEDELYFTPEMMEKIDRSIQQIENGECTVINNKEELRHYFDSL